MSSRWKRRHDVDRWVLLFLIGFPLSGLWVLWFRNLGGLVAGLGQLMVLVLSWQFGAFAAQREACPREFKLDEEPSELAARVLRVLERELGVGASLSFLMRRTVIWHEGIVCELESGHGLLVRLPTEGRPTHGGQPVVELYVFSRTNDGVVVGSWTRPRVRFDGVVSGFDRSFVEASDLVAAFPVGDGVSRVTCDDVMSYLRLARPFDSLARRLLMGPLPHVRRLDPPS